MSDILLSQKKKKKKKKKKRKNSKDAPPRRINFEVEVSRAGFSANQAKTLNTRKETRAWSFNKFCRVSRVCNKHNNEKEKRRQGKDLSDIYSHPSTCQSIANGHHLRAEITGSNESFYTLKTAIEIGCSASELSILCMVYMVWVSMNRVVDAAYIE